MRFSLVVCTRGRSSELVDLFQSLVLQNRTDFETILVDQNPDDRLVEVVAQFAPLFPLKHLRMTGSGLSRARNVGLDHVTGDLIGFPDDDCRYFKGYLDTVHDYFQKNCSIGGITGHPTPLPDLELDAHWQSPSMELNTVTVLNRCQEFTVFIRKEALRDLRYNERLGVGAETPWGADEGPDFLIRLMQGGARLVYFPRLFVFHPNKIATIQRSILLRAESYARGRGCLFRLYPFSQSTILKSVYRPIVGCGLYLLTGRFRRAAYYAYNVRGILRGLLMSNSELEEVRRAPGSQTTSIEPIPLPPLSPEPLVSVLIANYNYAHFLPAALDSLLAQTYSNWHAVICDDGSTDNSVAIIQQYSERDPRFELIGKSNGGQNSAFNASYNQVRGEIICILDADDLFHPDKIRAVVDSFHADPRSGVSNHFSQVIDAEGFPQLVTMHRFLDSGWLANKALQRGGCVYVPTTSCISLRRQVADLLFPIPSSQDRDLDGYVAMVCQLLTPICVIDRQLSSYRIHGNNMGGITTPTPERLRYELNLIETRTFNLKEFARSRFGERFARQIKLEDNPQYIQAALKLLAVEHTEHRLAHARELIRRHPNPSWRAIWRIIFAAPETISRIAIPWMHRSYRAKAVVHRLIVRGKAMAT